MSWNLDDVSIGGQLTVGIGFPIGLGIGPTKINGSAYIEGPLLVGNSLSFPLPEASVMVARNVNPDIGGLVPSIFKVTSRAIPPIPPTPIDVVLGDPTGPVGVSVFCGPMPFVVQSTAIELITLTNYSLLAATRFQTGASEDIGAKAFTGAKTELGSDSNVALAFNMAPIIGDAPFDCPDYSSKTSTLNETFGIASSKKPFDILHPTKDGYRLRHVSLEGPAAEVYFRGTLKNNNNIEFPDYWKGLVDQETITVSLTPIGTYQQLYYEQTECKLKIKVFNSSGDLINCSYTVFGERKDTTKNISEYKGLTPNDYPGDNREYRLS